MDLLFEWDDMKRKPLNWVLFCGLLIGYFVKLWVARR
jgi:hypothetical protein